MKFLTTELDSIPWIRHGFFTRTGGVSGGLYSSLNCGARTEDSPAHVRVNRARAAEALGLDPERLVIARQVHGAVALPVTGPWDNYAAPEADALVTGEEGVALGVLTADCAPVLFVSEKERVIGAAHAGWRGALGGVLEETVAQMKKMGARAENIAAAVGPCIGPASYEVRDDFRAPFIAQDHANAAFFRPAPKAGHQLFDLPGYVADRLRRAGIGTIHDVRQDTLTDEPSFFSNRRAFLRNENGFGLQLSVIAIK